MDEKHSQKFLFLAQAMVTPSSFSEACCKILSWLYIYKNLYQFWDQQEQLSQSIRVRGWGILQVPGVH